MCFILLVVIIAVIYKLIKSFTSGCSCKKKSIVLDDNELSFNIPKLINFSHHEQHPSNMWTSDSFKEAPI